MTWTSAPKIRIQDRVEVVLRIGVGCFFGYCLGIAYLPTLVPTAFRFLPGVVVATLSISIPTLMFAIGAIIPSVVVMLVVIAGAATMLLAAATVSDGLFVRVFAVYALLVTSLYTTGKHYTQTSGEANALIALAAINGLTFRPIVQQQEQQQEGGGGGMEVVRLMWTEKGLENPAAVWRNFLVASCLGLACLVLAIALPPFRTLRRLLSRSFLPETFNQINAVVLLSSSPPPPGEEPTDLLLPLLHSWDALGKEGSIADKTFFEPRICKSWSEDLVPPLKDLVVETEDLILASLLLAAYNRNNNEDGGGKDSDAAAAAILQDTASLLKACGNALSSNAETDIQQLQDWTDNLSTSSGDMGYGTFMANDLRGGKIDDEKNPDVSNASYIFQGAQRVRTKTLAYLEALNYPESMPQASIQERTVRMLKSALLWIAVPLLPQAQFAESLYLLFQPSKWDYTDILWRLEIVAGYVVLIMMGVYWEGFANFRITPPNSSVGAVYIGWHMFGYAFALMPTLEGTIKKGLQRALGTCVGGFSAWLGIIVCSGSYDENTEINPYGLIAWLTVTTMVYAYFFGLDMGIASRLGMSKDHGYIGEYTSLTQALIALEVFTGKGDRDGLTVNRIVATLTGVFAAMIVMLIPPYVKGGDPKHLRDCLNELEDAFILLLKTFSDENQCSEMKSDGYTASLLEAATEKYQFALFVWNDADELRSLPIFKVNQDLKILLEGTAVLGSSIRHLSDRLAKMVSSGMDLAEIQNEIKSLLEEIESNAIKERYSATCTSCGIDDVVSMARRIQDDFVRLEKDLDNMSADTL